MLRIEKDCGRGAFPRTTGPKNSNWRFLSAIQILAHGPERVAGKPDCGLKAVFLVTLNFRLVG